jgi:hypothetical protein
MDAERRSAAFDVLLAVALTVVLQLQVWFGEEEGEVFELKPLSALLMLLLTVPLIWRRRHILAWSLERKEPDEDAPGSE